MRSTSFGSVISRQTNSHRFSSRARAVARSSGVGGGDWRHAAATARRHAAKTKRAGSQDPALFCLKISTLCLSVVPFPEEGRVLQLRVIRFVLQTVGRGDDGHVVPVRRIEAEQVLHEEVVALPLCDRAAGAMVSTRNHD